MAPRTRGRIVVADSFAELIEYRITAAAGLDGAHLDQATIAVSVILKRNVSDLRKHDIQKRNLDHGIVLFDP